MPEGAILAVFFGAGAALTLLSARGTPPARRGLSGGLALAAILAFLFYNNTSDRMISSMAFALAAGAGAVAAAIDARRHLLPDAGASLIAIGALISAIIRDEVINALIASVISAAVLIVAAMLTYRPARGKSLGEGDVILAGACGLWLTPEQVPYALICATVVTAVVGFTIGVTQRDHSGRMPFAPGIAIGYAVAAAGLIPVGFIS
ncbi:MAG: hypothetical protein DHS20C06_02940 [Hyphobacterium sp.]|nr:MAG: hypothetical protein DHS20C06_02940 [Hyphobacterium sp.]